MVDDYIEINRSSWNSKTDIHIKSDFYDNEAFLDGKSSLNDIELNLLGDVKGKTILHLQCHFGQDTISLSRLGANVTGVDLSDKSIQRARELARDLRANVDFLCCDIYDLPKYLNKKFDIVFTSYGVIGWLPDLGKWASIISTYLKPKGKFVFVEFHPFVWMFDDKFKKISYDYFNSGAIIESFEGTYAEKDAKIELDYVMWNHSLGEVLNNLIKYDLEIKKFDEFDYSPYDCFSNMIEVEKNQFRIKQLKKKIPMVYSVLAIKK